MSRVAPLVVVAAACGGAQGPAATPKHADRTSLAADAFLDAVARKDVATIASALAAPLEYHGLLFADPDCATHFAGDCQLTADRLPAFAGCLAGLSLARAHRTHALHDVSVLEYPPGIEIAIAFAFHDDKATVGWIGYSGHADPRATLPTITGAALDALRTAPASLTPEQRAALDSARQLWKLDHVHAWLEVCVDADAHVAVTPHEVSVPQARDAFVDAARAWQLRPFMVGGHAIPVCAFVRSSYPDDGSPEILPPSSGQNPTEAHLSPQELDKRRVSGSKLIVPSDDDKIAIGNAGVGKIVGSFKVCIDETGSVARVETLRSTGLLSYDQKLQHTIEHTWRYEAMPGPVCSAVTFIYSQSGTATGMSRPEADPHLPPGGRPAGPAFR